MVDRDILEQLRAFRKKMPVRWHGNAMLDDAIAEIDRLRATTPAAPAGGERETALRDQVFKTIEVLQSPDVTMDSEFRSFTAKQLQKALDYAAPAQSNGEPVGRRAAPACGRAGGNCQCTSIEECPRAFAQQNQE